MDSLNLQEFVDARRSAGLSNAPLCSWSSSPPQELKEAPSETLSANAGFVSFGSSENFCISWFLDDKISI